MGRGRNSLKRQFWGRLWLSALLRIETLATAGGSMLALLVSVLPPAAERLPGIAPLTIIVFGVMATMWMAWEGLDNAGRQQAAVRAILVEPIDVASLEDDGLRRIAAHVLDTSRRIVGLFRPGGGNVVGSDQRFVAQLDGWLGHVLKLARRLDALVREAELSKARIAAAKDRIDALEARLEGDSDARSRDEIRITVEGYRRNMALAEEFEVVVERATLKLEQSANLISSIHGHLLLDGAIGLEEGAAARLHAEIAADTIELDAIATAVGHIRQVA